MLNWILTLSEEKITIFYRNITEEIKREQFDFKDTIEFYKIWYTAFVSRCTTVFFSVHNSLTTNSSGPKYTILRPVQIIIIQLIKSRFPYRKVEIAHICYSICHYIYL